MDDGRDPETAEEGPDGRNRPARPETSASGDPGVDGERDDPHGGEVDGAPPVAVGDGRKKHVRVITDTGERHEHGDAYLKQSSVAFLVSPDESFPDGKTTRYGKDHLNRVEVTQHHSMCFITTATAGEGPALDALRDFRDSVLARSSPGRALVAAYEAVSPPIATTLSRHSDARTTRLVRWLVRLCGALARRRERASPPARIALTALLVALYVLGVGCAALGHLTIWLRERR